MKFNFDKIINRKDTNSIKWDCYKKFLFDKENLLPMWVADMDFESPPEVKKSIIERAKHGIYGYSMKSEKYYQSIINWTEKRYDWEIEKEWIVYTPGIVPAINIAIQIYTEPGDGIIIQSPVYSPFFHSVEQNNRKLLDNKLIFNKKLNKYEIDFEGLKNLINKNTRMIILCNPHNPVGRVFSKKELKKLGKIAEKNNLLIFSDEIHSDIIYPDNKHIPIASINDDLSKRTITGIAPSKTFNIAGLKSSSIIIKNKKLRDKFKQFLMKLHLYSTNIFAIEATIAAYTRGEEWLDSLLKYLNNNLDIIENYINDIDGLNFTRPEGTFLAWLDFNELNISHDKLKKKIYNEAEVGLNDGKSFGENGKGFMRLNFACPEKTLIEGLDRIKKVFNT